MANYGNARKFNNFQVEEEEDLEQDEYETVVMPRPRANVPPGPTVVPPQYARMSGAVRTVGAPPNQRPNSIPQPFPPVNNRPIRAMVPRAPMGALQAPALPNRQRSPRFDLLGLLNPGKNGLRYGLMAVGAIVCLMLVYFVVSNVLSWWQTWQDDMTYGRPRTMQIDQFVGHGEEDGTPSHFIAQNNNRQVTVIEYPGGDVTKTRVIPGPRLFGKDTELAPVKIRFQDANGDGHVDMILSVDNQEIIYINENSNFRPINNEERNRYAKMSGGSK